MARPGRPRRIDADRYPSGQIRRQDDPRSVVLDARQRHHGISKDQAAHQEAGDPAKRALIDETHRLCKTIDEIRKRHTNYQAALQVPRVKSASDYDTNGGFDSRDGADPEYMKRCQQDVRRWEDLRDAFKSSGPSALSLIHHVVIEGREPTSRHGCLRCALRVAAAAMSNSKSKG